MTTSRWVVLCAVLMLFSSFAVAVLGEWATADRDSRVGMQMGLLVLAFIAVAIVIHR